MSKRETTQTQTETYKKWYENNKQSFAERRKQRYRDDPEYRKKAVERAREYRMRKKLEREANK